MYVVLAVDRDWRERLLAARGMSRDRIALGKSGEDLACAELERRGYAIVARRYRRRGGEMDIIARDGATMVFVEVKAREGHAFGDGGRGGHGAASSGG